MLMIFKKANGTDMWTLMKTTKLLIIISFLAFTEKGQASDFWSQLWKGYISNEEDDEYLSGSDGLVKSEEDEDYDFGDDGVHPEYTPVIDNLIVLAKEFTNYWYAKKQDDEPEATKYIPKAERSGDGFSMSTGTEDPVAVEAEEIKNTSTDTNTEIVEAEKIEKEPVLTAEPIKNPSITGDLPTAEEVKQERIVVPEDQVHSVDSITTADPIEYGNESKLMPLPYLNELKQRTAKNNLNQVNINRFIEKAKSAHLISYDEMRRNLRPAPATTSPSYEKMVKLLEDSFMGDFDFSSVKPVNVPAKKPKHYKDKLLEGFLGIKWLDMNWTDLKTSEFYDQIKGKLQTAAPNTIKYLPSLAPKTTYERDALENWLISGLLAAYPTLTDGVTKNDAIALILLAVLSKSFTNDSNDQTITELINELYKYIGDLPNKFPLDQLTFSPDESKEAAQTRLMGVLIGIVNDKNFPYATKVIDDIKKLENNE